jgi:hypothetical protein
MAWACTVSIPHSIYDIHRADILISARHSSRKSHANAESKPRHEASLCYSYMSCKIQHSRLLPQTGPPQNHSVDRLLSHGFRGRTLDRYILRLAVCLHAAFSVLGSGCPTCASREVLEANDAAGLFQCQRSHEVSSSLHPTIS